MRIIMGMPDRLDYPNPVVTIGNFDGVHIGHQKIFRRVVEKAKEINGTPMAITFDPHPVRVLAPERGLKILTTFEDKANLISRAGIKVLICISFSKEFAKTDPDEFIKDMLVNRLGVKWVTVGHNYAFGKGKKGTTLLLRRRGEKYGFGVSIVRYAKVYDDIVSSSRIRSLLLRGRVCEASKMLGRAYHIEGTVIKGAGRGTPLLHTPTANITTPNELVPKEGVYAVRVSIQNDVYDGVANIGKNPTFATTFGNMPMSYEVHIFDFNQNLLGEKIKMHFIDRIRDEKKFSGIDELQEQIKKDIQKAKEILSKRKDLLYL
ncbi:MAG: bifunctional riboflavin kinase/FAD synthetase [Thermodesulfovibrionales bacterium]|jgi:riboflavin kinase/FMN adenylyltransferase|nr:bifunctional riboflavin kinase/FAD synthetase [Thermodesulfovibrionales bacterium]